MAVLRDVADFLVAALPGLASDQLFLGEEPAVRTDPCVTIYERPGPPGVTTHDRIRPAIEFPRLMLNFRSKDYEAARLLAQSGYEALFVNEVTQNGTRYPGFRPLMPPFEMGPPDANARRQIGFLLHVEETS